MSLFATMNLANSALHAAQLNVSVAGHNIANADRPGFSRQRVEQSALYRRSTAFGQQGFGVSVTGISRIRNEFIDIQIRRQSHELGRHQAIDHALESMENIVREPSDSGIMEFMNRFFNSWDFLVNNADDMAARTSVFSSAEMLVGVFRNISSELHTLKTSRNNELIANVGEVNNIAREIFNLNTEISLAAAGGGVANDSLDRRDILMRRLAEFTDFNAVTDSTGQVSISISGHILVSAVSVNSIELFADNNAPADATGFIPFGLRMATGGGILEPTGGRIRGLIDARDIFIPAMEGQLDELVRGFVTAVNNQHREGFNLRGHTGFNFFDPNGLTARTISVSQTIATDVSNIAAAGGGGAMSGIIRNTIMDPPGMPSVGTPFLLSNIDGSNGWNSGDPDSARGFNLVNGTVVVTTNPGGVALIENQDFKVDYVLGTVQLLGDVNGNNIYEGQSLSISFRHHTGNFTGVGNNENALAISQLRTAAILGSVNMQGNPNSTIGEFYGNLIARLGLDRREAVANVETRQFLIDGYDEHQDCIAGVSLDEEAANIIRFQHSYQAAARIFSAVQSMLDTLLNL